jgi:hypothetical protein
MSCCFRRGEHRKGWNAEGDENPPLAPALGPLEVAVEKIYSRSTMASQKRHAGSNAAAGDNPEATAT